jgi:hypothetical protein
MPKRVHGMCKDLEKNNPKICDKFNSTDCYNDFDTKFDKSIPKKKKATKGSEDEKLKYFIKGEEIC